MSGMKKPKVLNDISYQVFEIVINNQNLKSLYFLLALICKNIKLLIEEKTLIVGGIRYKSNLNDYLTNVNRIKWLTQGPRPLYIWHTKSCGNIIKNCDINIIIHILFRTKFDIETILKVTIKYDNCRLFQRLLKIILDKSITHQIDYHDKTLKVYYKDFTCFKIKNDIINFSEFSNSILLTELFKSISLPDLACYYGSLKILKFLIYDSGSLKQYNKSLFLPTSSAYILAAAGKQFEVIKMLKGLNKTNNGIPALKWGEYTSIILAGWANSSQLDWFKENKGKFHIGMYKEAAKHENIDCIKWLEANNFTYHQRYNSVAEGYILSKNKEKIDIIFIDTNRHYINYDLYDTIVITGNFELFMKFQQYIPLTHPYINLKILCNLAASRGYLCFIEYILANTNTKWNGSISTNAGIGGHINIIEYALKNKYSLGTSFINQAVKHNHLEFIKWCFENIKKLKLFISLNTIRIGLAQTNNEIIIFLFENWFKNIEKKEELIYYAALEHNWLFVKYFKDRFGFSSLDEKTQTIIETKKINLSDYKFVKDSFDFIR